ncbi:MAG TPA: stalk domain-containing protein [Clostridia bacterium]|nr:stalk domain-containing protein [Clostridia bacterium]
MKTIRHLTIWTIIILSCLLMFTFADDITKVIQAAESNARIIYNDKEVSLGVKLFSIEGSNYLSVRALAVLFDKNIDWNQKEQKIIISDKPNTAMNSLKLELDTKNKSILELQDKLKKLETDIASSKKLNIRELQDELNNEYGEYAGVTYRVILSGNEDEIRVKIEVDLSKDKSAWSRLTGTKREELVKEVCGIIAGEYNFAKIKGYIKDIDVSKKLMTFQYTWQGELETSIYRNFSTISTLEDRFNNDYDGYFNEIHFTFALSGNDNRMEYTIYIQKNRFEEKWDKLSDSTLKNFMKKLCSEINSEFKDCYIYGYVYDTDSSSELAVCEQVPEGEFTFDREQQ